MATEFISSEGAHWYESKKHKGTYYPSVTTVIGDSFPKGKGFERYLADQESYEKSQEILEAAGNRGTRVHNATELLESGKTLIRESYSLEEWQMLIGFVAWHKEYQPKPIAIEQSVISDKLKTGGTIDRVYDIDGVITLLDIKTSSAVHQNYWIQTAVYKTIWEETHKEKIERTAILRLAPRRKLGYEYVLHDEDEIKVDFLTWKGVRAIWDYRNPNAKPKILELPDELVL